MSSRRDVWLAYLMILPAVCAVLGFILGPAYDVFRLSLTQFSAGREVTFGSWRNFATLMTDPVFPIVMRNTAIWIVAGTVGCAFVGLAIGAYLARNTVGTTLLRAMVLLPWILPDVVTAMAWKWMLHGQVGVVSAALQAMGITSGSTAILGSPGLVMWALVTVVIWRKVPLVALVLCAAIRSVPAELHEAARIDGATPLERFRYVTLPHIAFPFTAITVICMIWMAAEFTLPWVMTGGGPAHASHIMSTYIYEQSFKFFDWGVASAMSVVNLLVLAALVGTYLLVMRRSWASQGAR